MEGRRGQGEVVPDAAGKVDLAAALATLGRPRRAPGDGRGRRGPPRGAARPPDSSTGSSSTWAARCSAPGGKPGLDWSGPAVASPTRPGSGSSDATVLGDDVRLDYLPVPGAAGAGRRLMFTGIVEELGTVRAIARRARAARASSSPAPRCSADAGLGDSIAVNGCCLTVVELGDGWWAADAQIETLDRTTLGALAPGDPVNLERPAAPRRPPRRPSRPRPRRRGRRGHRGRAPARRLHRGSRSAPRRRSPATSSRRAR